MVKRKKILLITTFIIIAAIAIVICVSLFNGKQPTQFDGTLVEATDMLVHNI